MPLLTYNDTAECRTCGLPKTKADARKIQCDACYQRILRMDRSDTGALLRGCYRGAKNPEFIAAFKALPTLYTWAFYLSGSRVNVLQENERMTKVEADRPEIMNLHELVHAITGDSKPWKLGVEVVDSDVVAKEAELPLCPVCGSRHEAFDNSEMPTGAYAHYDANQRILTINPTCSPDRFQSGIITSVIKKYLAETNVELYAESLRSVNLMWADIEARKWTEEGLEDTLTDHDKLERVAKVIVSPQCFSQWDDYLADLILAKYNLHPTIDDVRVGYMQRDALLLVDYVEHVFARKFETLLLERNVPTA